MFQARTKERGLRHQIESTVAMRTIGGLLDYITPKEGMQLARVMLDALIEEDWVNYGEFEGSKAAQKHIKAASRELHGLS